MLRNRATETQPNPPSPAGPSKSDPPQMRHQTQTLTKAAHWPRRRRHVRSPAQRNQAEGRNTQLLLCFIVAATQGAPRSSASFFQGCLRGFACPFPASCSLSCPLSGASVRWGKSWGSGGDTQAWTLLPGAGSSVVLPPSPFGCVLWPHLGKKTSCWKGQRPG